jgi:hypothetical protein
LPESTDEKGPATTESLNEPETHESSGDVHSTQNKLSLDRVFYTSRLKNGGTVVEKVVDTGPLLEEVNEETEERSPKKLGNVASGVEAFTPATLADLSLLLENVLHFLEVILDKRVVKVVLHTTKATQCYLSSFPVAPRSKPSRRLWNDKDTDAEREREKDAEADDNSPRGAAGVHPLETVTGDVGDKNTDGDHELVRGNDGTADFSRSTFGLEHRDTDRQVTDTQTSDESTHHHMNPRLHRRNLNDITNDEDSDSECHTLSSTPPISGTIVVS